MLSRELGFSASWKMLTHERGWYKPLCILALLGWIPILGQIVVLGYALEWARFTAWGIDTAPRQRGIDIGKILVTGGRAFLVLLLMGFVIRTVLAVLGLGGWAFFGSFLVMGLGTTVSSLIEGFSALSVWGILGAVVSLLLGTFLTAAMMRATLYDSFGAGWRIDRLFQMIARDPAGFLKTWLVSFIGGVACVAYACVAALVGGTISVGGFAAIVSDGYGIHYGYAAHDLQHLLAWGAGPFMLMVLLVIAAIFVYGVISIAMQLVAVNAMGQWFCRFEVGRWGVSAAPLPDGVPVRPASETTWSPNGGAPTRPAGGAGAAVTSGSAVGAAGAAGASETAAGSYWDNDDPVMPTVPEEPATPGAGPVVGTTPAEPPASAEPVAPAEPAAPDAPIAPSTSEPEQPVVPEQAEDSTALADAVEGDPIADDEPAADASGRADNKKSDGPILLGPVSDE